MEAQISISQWIHDNSNTPKNTPVLPLCVQTLPTFNPWQPLIRSLFLYFSLFQNVI